MHACMRQARCCAAPTAADLEPLPSPEQSEPASSYRLEPECRPPGRSARGKMGIA